MIRGKKKDWVEEGIEEEEGMVINNL